MVSKFHPDYCSSESEAPPDARVKSYPGATSVKVTTESVKMTLPASWVESSSSSSSSTPTTPRAKLEAPADIGKYKATLKPL
jgi:hypothetical protein